MNYQSAEAGVLYVRYGSIRDVVYFIGAGPTRTGLAKTNSLVAHAIRRRHARVTICAHRGYAGYNS